ncbi:MAG: hypothetical protein K9H16_11275 [Bacteroidales bacterium]|nr:hypothetical protein [Bacteroidales bacterium]
MASKKKKRQIKRKFKTITFKLSERQKKSLDKYSKARNTTPLKLIKRAIDVFISLPNELPPPAAPTTENQLDLFVEAELATRMQESIQEKITEK